MLSTKLAIIGCGAAVRRYYVPALKNHPNLINELMLVDKNTDAAKELSGELGGGSVHSDYHDVIDSINGAVVAVPNSLHYPIALELLKAGVHVLCEKPLAETLQEAQELNKIAKEKNVFLSVNNTRRMFPSFTAIKELIADGKIGEITSISYTEGNTFAWPSSTGFYVNPKISSKGILSDVGPHVLDLICWWIGGKPEVKSFLDDSYGGPESVVKMSARHGACNIQIFINRLNDIDCSYEIRGKLGVIKGKVFEWDKIMISQDHDIFAEKRLPCMAKNYPSFVQPIIDNFVNVVAKEEQPLVSGIDVQDSIELIEDCYLQRNRFELPWNDSIQVSSNSFMGKTLVTGATGFIGGRIAEFIHFSKRRNVVAAVHQWSNAARIGRFPIDIVQMDLMDKDSIKASLEGVTEIIHCAKGPEEVTIQGTVNLLDAALNQKVERFIHLSTTEIYGNVSGTIIEETEFSYTGNEYNRTKIDAEKACWEYYAKGLPISVLRPSIVYGPFSGNWSVHFAKMLLDGKWGLYQKYGEGLCNLVFVDDLVNAILTALDNEKAVGEAFNITGPEVVTWNEYFAKYNDILGMPSLRTIKKSRAGFKTFLMQPVRRLGGVVRDHFMEPVKKIANYVDFVDKLMRRTEAVLKATPAPDELKLFNKNAFFSGQKFENLVGFKPQYTVDKGLQLTKQWLKHQGIV